MTLYRASGDYQKLAASTKVQWGPWFDRIAAYFELSIAAFDNPKVRPIIRQWRNKYADTPRTADMGMQVLSRVCGYAVEQGKLAVNPCEGIKALYSADRAAIIWTDADIARIKQAVSPEVGHAIDLAAMTGLGAAIFCGYRGRMCTSTRSSSRPTSRDGGSTRASRSMPICAPCWHASRNGR